MGHIHVLGPSNQAKIEAFDLDNEDDLNSVIGAGREKLGYKKDKTNGDMILYLPEDRWELMQFIIELLEIEDVSVPDIECHKDMRGDPWEL